jgi:hypothetical protein
MSNPIACNYEHYASTPSTCTQESAIMYTGTVSLLSLPDEFLLQIAACLSTTNVEEVHGGYEATRGRTLFRPFKDGHNPDTDLRHFCLTARKLRPVACEVLYHHPKLPSSAQPPVARRAAPLLHLLRTLVDRPDLARFVQKINLLVYPRCCGVSSEIRSWNIHAWNHEWDYLAPDLAQVVERQEIRL